MCVLTRVCTSHVARAIVEELPNLQHDGFDQITQVRNNNTETNKGYSLERVWHNAKVAWLSTFERNMAIGPTYCVRPTFYWA
jgi:hypothetical protein